MNYSLEMLTADNVHDVARVARRVFADINQYMHDPDGGSWPQFLAAAGAMTTVVAELEARSAEGIAKTPLDLLKQVVAAELCFEHPDRPGEGAALRGLQDLFAKDARAWRTYHASLAIAPEPAKPLPARTRQAAAVVRALPQLATAIPPEAPSYSFVTSRMQHVAGQTPARTR